MSTISTSNMTRLPPLPSNVLHSIDFSQVTQTPTPRVSTSSCTSMETTSSRNKRILVVDDSVNPNPAKRRKVDCSDEIASEIQINKNGFPSSAHAQQPQIAPPPSANRNGTGNSNPNHVQLDLSQADSDTIKAILSLAHHQQQQQQQQTPQPSSASSLQLQTVLHPTTVGPTATAGFQHLLQSLPLSDTNAVQSSSNILPIRNTDASSLVMKPREPEPERQPMLSLRNVALPNILVAQMQHRQQQPQPPQPSSQQQQKQQLEQAMQPLLDVRGLLQTVDDYGPKQINMYRLESGEIDGLISTECTKSEIKKRIKEELLDIIAGIDKSLLDSEKRIQSLGTLKLIHSSTNSSASTPHSNSHSNSNTTHNVPPPPNVNGNDPISCKRRPQYASVPIPTPKFQNLPKFTLMQQNTSNADKVKSKHSHPGNRKRMKCPLPNMSLSACELPKTPPYPQHLRDYDHDLTDVIDDTIARGQHHQAMDSKQQASLCDALVQMSFEASLSPSDSRSTTLEQPIENVQDALLAAKLMNLPPSNFNQIQLSSSTNTLMFDENENGNTSGDANGYAEDSDEHHGVHIDPDVCLSMNLKTTRSSFSALQGLNALAQAAAVSTNNNNDNSNSKNNLSTLLAAISGASHNQILFCPPSFNETSSTTMPTLEAGRKAHHHVHPTSTATNHLYLQNASAQLPVMQHNGHT